MKHKRNGERGIVSILTVLFLTIILTIITVAFLRIMNDEQVQTLNDDLSRSAYASALSGIEDAKRALKYCNSLTGATKTTCLSHLTVNSCPGIIAPGSMLVTDGIVQANGQVGGDPSLNQRYSCLRVDMSTNDVLGQAQANKPVLINLMPETGSFRTVVIRWHKISEAEVEGSDGPAYFTAAGARQNTRETAWVNGAGESAVAMLRAQIMAYESADGSNTVNQSDIDRKTAAAYFVPRGGGYPTSGTVGQVVAPRGGTAEWRFTDGLHQNIRCSASEATYGGYSCEARITFGFRTLASDRSDSQDSRYFLMLNSLYDNPYFQVTLEDSGGDTVPFYGVQPEVDVTGAASDVYRRVKARIAFDGGFTPKDAVQSGASLCKAFYVTADPWQPGDPSQAAPGAICSGLTDGPEAPVPPTDPTPLPEPSICNEPESQNTVDYVVNANYLGLTHTVPVNLTMPLTPGCQYQFMHLRGDSHPNQQEKCLDGEVESCNAWRQPKESYYVELVTSSGSVVRTTPQTGDVPDRFAPGTPGLVMNPLGMSGTEAVWVRYNFTAPAGSPITRIIFKHVVQDPADNEGSCGTCRVNSAHIYGFRFDAS